MPRASRTKPIIRYGSTGYGELNLIGKRHVLFVGGYLSESPAWYHVFFSRELSRYRKTSGARVQIGNLEMSDDMSAASWMIRKQQGNQKTDTQFTILRCDHIVETDAKRSLVKRTFLLILTFFDFLLSGFWFRLFKVNWRFALQVLYPYIALTLFAMIGIGMAWLAGPYLTDIGMTGWLHGLGLAVIAWGLFYGLCRLDRRRNFRAQHMLDLYITTAKHVRRKHQNVDRLIDEFTNKILEVEQNGAIDELLLIGHSFGAVNMLEATARAMTRNPEFGKNGVKVSLLTFGSILPVMVCHPLAGWLRNHVEQIATSPDVLWVDYQSRKDVITASGFDAVRDLGLNIPENRIMANQTRQIRFRDLVSAEFYNSMRINFFRLHFQYLRANDYADRDYDFFDMISGSQNMYARMGQTDSAKDLSSH
ncbi:MAG: hypothetical protein K8F25_14865, partial [Fimbriimonadaceae bacterium]|nr:hypothetical protein [Alphaproteobacteria bacterium]